MFKSFRKLNNLICLHSRGLLFTTVTRLFVSSFATMKIGTHDGVFHCDDALTCYMLKVLPEYKEAEIVRTRDPEKLKECDIVVDVGAEFDHNKKRYDHHQREFNYSLSKLRPELGDKYVIKLSSAGLIYTYYGERVIQNLIPSVSLTPEDLRVIYKHAYENIIQEIDAIDNGVPMTDEKPRYNINTNLSSRVARLNPEWNTEGTADLDTLFQKAMELAGEEFAYNINYLVTVWLPARILVRKALENRFDVHKSGQIVEFTERYPWKQHLFNLEAEMGLNDAGKEITYVIFKDKPMSWRVQCVPQDAKSFITRKPLKKKWWGVRDENLSEVAGIDDCVFCHSTGFIGGNKTREGALKMAIASLEDEELETEENGIENDNGDSNKKIKLSSGTEK